MNNTLGTGRRARKGRRAVGHGESLQQLRTLTLGMLIRGLLNSDLSIETAVIKMMDLSDSVKFRQYGPDRCSSHDRKAVREAFHEVPA